MYSALRVIAVAGLVAVAAPKCEAPTRDIVFPAAGQVTYTDTFGAPRSGGRTHEGQDLMGRKGTPLVAAADGVVTSVRHSAGGLSGNMLRITDADGWQYVYIHINNDRPGTDDGANIYEQAFADGIRVGQRVKAGEPVAFLGDSGNAESTGAHLHFELIDPSGVVVNAFSSLQAARRVTVDPAAVSAAAPFGAVDQIVAGPAGTVRASGWALDRAGDSAVPISIYVDGNPVVTGLAANSRPDVAAAFPGYSDLHGYDITASGIAPGLRRVCVVQHNAGAGGGSSRPGCQSITVI